MLGSDLRIICGFSFSGQCLLPHYHSYFGISSIVVGINVEILLISFVLTVVFQLARSTGHSFFVFSTPINAINIYPVTQARNLAVIAAASLRDPGISAPQSPPVSPGALACHSPAHS